MFWIPISNASEIRQISMARKLQTNFKTQKDDTVRYISIIKFDEGTNIFVRYNEKFVKSSVR